MIEMCSKSIIVEVKAVKQYKGDENSFGQRLKKEREKKGLTQAELIKMANEYGGTDMPESVPALSQLELGVTKRIHVDLLLALSKILNTNAHYLITGEEVGEILGYSEEAERVARLIDAMLPRSRHLLKIIAEHLVETDRYERKRDQEITRLLDDVSHLLTSSQRSMAADILRSLRAADLPDQ